MKCMRVSLGIAIVVAAVAIGWYRMQVFGERPAGPKPNLVVVTGGNGQFWQLIANGAKAAAADQGADLRVLMPEADEDLDAQIRLLSGIELDNVDGVAVSPLDAEGESPLINRMTERAIVVTVDSDAPLSARHSYVGTSNIAAGRTAAKLVKEALPEGGTIVVLLANLKKQNMIDRKQGFEQTLATSEGPAYEVVDYLVDDSNPERAEQLLGDFIEAHPDLDCVVGMNAQHGPRILRVLEGANRLGEIKVVAFDEVDETLDGVEAGNIFATVTQDPYQYGYECVRTLTELANATEDQRPMPGSRSTLSISTRVVRQGDVEDFRSHLKSRLQSPR